MEPAVGEYCGRRVRVLQIAAAVAPSDALDCANAGVTKTAPAIPTLNAARDAPKKVLFMSSPLLCVFYVLGWDFYILMGRRLGPKCPLDGHGVAAADCPGPFVYNASEINYIVAIMKLSTRGACGELGPRNSAPHIASLDTDCLPEEQTHS